ncbi:protein pygopus-like [Physella acuta]|uniref:protein pygopus-like n=1 Tax=Physella acuta TaxID=109671 RepID=UPI0027DE150F|nr:protein pygopus-like [Physella acuta]
MAHYKIVLLLVATYVSSSTAQFGSNFGNQSPFGGQFGGQSPFGGLGGAGAPPGFGGLGGVGGLPGFPGGFNPLFGGQGFPQAFQPPQILTCIGNNEAYDQFRVTIRPESGSFPGQNPAFQFGTPRELQRQDWRISAVYLPAASVGVSSPTGTSSLHGNFFLAVTRYGRTDGQCAGLGGILQNEDLVSAGAPRGGPFQQYGNNMFGQMTPAGYIQDPIIINQGGTSYSSVIRNVAEVDLNGHGIVICLDALAQRPTTTCCTISKDSLPATERIGSTTTVPGPYSGTAIAGLGGSTYPSGTGTNTGLSTGGNTLFTGTNTGGLF